MNKWWFRFLSFILFILFTSQLGFSAGLELPVNGSAATKGRGGAGVAIVSDVSSILTNPAGLAYLKNNQAAGGLGSLFPRVSYTPPGFPTERSDFKFT
ncbi:MAG TPA: hypothetical protein VJL87_04605, partial [Bdellovibrionota bacterium]|nr:hypothetical protein [Bdellovibrionota bacterium]